MHPAITVALAHWPTEHKSWLLVGWTVWSHIHSETLSKPWAFYTSPVHEPESSPAPRVCWTSSMRRNSVAHKSGTCCSLPYIHAILSPCLNPAPSGSIRPTAQKRQYVSKYGLRNCGHCKGHRDTEYAFTYFMVPAVYELEELRGRYQSAIAQNCWEVLENSSFLQSIEWPSSCFFISFQTAYFLLNQQNQMF